MENPDDTTLAPLVLADSLDLTAATPLATQLLAARGKPVTLDASGVQRLGAQCLQVLLAARQAWSADGQPWRVVNPSPEFADTAALMGCRDLASPDLACANPVQD
jgi:chemotaxis protein CheX